VSEGGDGPDFFPSGEAVFEVVLTVLGELGLSCEQALPVGDGGATIFKINAWEISIDRHNSRKKFVENCDRSRHRRNCYICPFKQTF
jgi:hypothetical protein